MSAPSYRVITPELRDAELEARRELEALSNWGRWGADDERGAINAIDFAAIQRAVAAVKLGRTYSLADDIAEHGVPLRTGRPPSQLFMVMDGGGFAVGAGSSQGGGFVTPTRPSPYGVADEFFAMTTHAVCTHIDALSHCWFDEKMYNGFPGHEMGSRGSERLGIEKFSGVITRGVMLDMARLRGVECCDGLDYFTRDDVLQCCEHQGVTIEKGDAVIIHTGWSTIYPSDPHRWNGSHPGVGASAALYLAQRDICLLVADTMAVEPAGRRWEESGDPPDPRAGITDLHNSYLRNLGIYLLEMTNTTELARDKVYSFLFACAPLKLRGLTGSPVNPLALA